MATTTVPLIRANLISVLETLTPVRQADVRFRRANRRYPMDGSTRGSTGFMRRFQITNEGQAETLTEHSTQARRIEPFVLLVSYPMLSGVAGEDEMDDLWDMIREDKRTLGDAIRSPSNYLTGECERTYPVESYESDEEMKLIFLQLEFSVQFNEAQTFST